MKTFTTIDTIRLYVMKAQTHKALQELYVLLRETKIPELLDQIVILSSNYNDIDRSASMGLGDFREEKNRINLALLKILTNLETDQTINLTPNKGKATGERIDALENKIDFLLNHVEKNDDVLFYGFSKSNLWKWLEDDSRDKLLQAHIIEKEVELDRFKDAMYLLIEVVVDELNHKFLQKFRQQYVAQIKSRDEIVQSFRGMNKAALFKYMQGECELSLHQISEILLKNIFKADKRELDGMGKQFYELFHQNFKVKNQILVVELFEKHQSLKLAKSIRGFTQTLVDVINLKEDVIHLLTNIQPRKVAYPKKESA